MTIDDAISFIHSVSWRGSRLGLSRIEELLELLGNPQKRLKFVHIAGTNGKGSTAAMLSSVLRAAGYKTGLYTSPFLNAFNERIQIDGQNISDESLRALTARVASCAEEMEDPPTEFEIVTALGFLHFAKERCDIVALEVGLGGRLDATNVIDSPLCAIITNIGLDHTKELGETVEKIAAEKCGIIKPGTSCVLYAQNRNVERIVAETCTNLGVSLIRTCPSELRLISDTIYGQKFSYHERPYHIRLLGQHQMKNAATVLEALDILRVKGFKIPEEAILRGLVEARWPARFEIVGEKPYFVVDGGHNPQGAEATAACIKAYFPDLRVTLLLGVSADKNYKRMADTLTAVADSVVAVTPNNPRALDAKTLAVYLQNSGKPVYAAESVETGVALSRELAGEDGLVVSTGSLFLAGDVRRIVFAKERENNL